MKPELPPERHHGVSDGVMVLAVLCVAILSWSHLAEIPDVSPWQHYGGIGLTFVLGLAGLTRRARWADVIRSLMGVWTIITPFLCGFTELAAALWICLAIGTVLAALSLPGIVAEHGRDPAGDLPTWA